MIVKYILMNVTSIKFTFLIYNYKGIQRQELANVE